MPKQKFGRGNYKRQRSYWEPVYAPHVSPSLHTFDWKTKNVKAIKECVCEADVLEATASHPRYSLKEFQFETCDFSGDFNFTKFTFDRCVFLNCDFSDSFWFEAKFSRCTFKRVSFSTAILRNCQFLECKWEDIGISSTEMHLENCKVSNPYSFIQAAYTNLDPQVLKQNNTDPSYQGFRLEGTKAKVARVLLSNLQGQGDDESFYDAVKAYTTQAIKAKIHGQLHMARSSVWYARPWRALLGSAYWLELILLTISGQVNRWGASVGRSLLYGALLIVIFSFCYSVSGIQATWAQSTLASLEITLLVGYTKYTSTQSDFAHQLTYAANMILGIWWYSIFVPTVVNRVNRTN